VAGARRDLSAAGHGLQSGDTEEGKIHHGDTEDTEKKNMVFL
jgi:hypothetical protein